MVTVAQVRTAIRREGEPVLIRRIATNVAPVLLNCCGVLKDYKSDELVNGVNQGDRKLIISNWEIEDQGWPGPPRRNDQVVVDGKTYTIQGCNTLKLRGVITRHNIQVRG